MPPRERPYQRRGRAVIAGAAGLIVLAQAVAGLLLDVWGLPVRFPSAARVLDNAARARRSPDVVILGSSRFQAVTADLAAGLLRCEPTAGDAVLLNASVPAGDPVAQEYVLRRLLRAGARPRLAVVEVSPETVGWFNERFRLHVHRQTTWKTLPAHLADAWRGGAARGLIVSRLVPLYAHRRELRRVAVEAVARCTGVASPPAADVGILGDPQPDARGGYESAVRAVQLPDPPPLPETLAEEWQAAARTAQRQFRDYAPGGEAAAALERLLARCRRRGIDVILVGAPNASCARALYTPAVDGPYREFLGRLCREYRCRFVDLRDAVPDSFFRDPAHENELGSRHLVRRLTAEVLVPYWREQAAGRVAAVD